jgi:type I restriction enzyme S subunit
MFVSDKFPTYQVDESKADRDYLGWYFRCPSLWDQATRMSTGSAAVSKLTLNPPRFLDLTIPLPLLSEQQRIVTKLEELASRIQQARSCRSLADELMACLFSVALRGLIAAKATDGVLGDVLLNKPRNGWSPHCDNADDGTPVLALGAVTGFRYRPREYKRTSLPTSASGHYWLHPGDLLITRSNTPELVGHAAIYDGNPSPCIYSDLMMRVPVDETKADKCFVWYWLQTPCVRDFIAANCAGTSPTMKKISQGTVMRIPFPSSMSVAEQRRIVTYLDELQAKADALKAQQAQSAVALDALLPSILDKAFKGEL